MRQGQGKLNIINVNGETNPAKMPGKTLLKEAPAHPPMAAVHRPAAKKAPPTEAQSGENSAPADEHQKPAKKPSTH